MTLVLFDDVPEDEQAHVPALVDAPGGPRVRYAAPDAQRCQGAVPVAGGGYYRCTFTALAGEPLCGHHRNAVKPTLRDLDNDEAFALREGREVLSRLVTIRAKRRRLLRVVSPDYAD